MRTRHPDTIWASLVTLLLLAAPAHALTIVSHYEGYVASSQTFEFVITFSAPPDFNTVDGLGRRKDDFQYWITWDLHPLDPLYPWIHPNVLVRLSTQEPGSIAVCNASGGSSDPDCTGGWGSRRGTVPFSLTGSVITFVLPRDVLGDPDGVFQYFLGVSSYGGFTDTRTGVSTQGTVATLSRTWGRIKTMYR
jgi:hypothetical protein